MIKRLNCKWINCSWIHCRSINCRWIAGTPQWVVRHSSVPLVDHELTACCCTCTPAHNMLSSLLACMCHSSPALHIPPRLFSSYPLTPHPSAPTPTLPIKPHTPALKLRLSRRQPRWHCARQIPPTQADRTHPWAASQRGVSGRYGIGGAGISSPLVPSAVPSAVPSTSP